MVATATLRQGEFIDQYKIDDPGNESGYDNHIFYIAFQVPEIVRQVSSINFHTFKEDLLCWEDGENPDCPCDDDGQGGQLSAGICYLDSIMAAAGIIVGADLTEAAENLIYLAFWHEYRTQNQMDLMLEEMIVQGLNELQQKRGMKFAYMSQGVDIVTANGIADNWINNGIKPTYDEYGLATIPVQDRRLLKLFGHTGWFDF